LFAGRADVELDWLSASVVDGGWFDLETRRIAYL
jgi:hypothetical protein